MTCYFIGYDNNANPTYNSFPNFFKVVATSLGVLR